MKHSTNNDVYDVDEVYGRIHSDKVFCRQSGSFRRALSKQLLHSPWTLDLDWDEQSDARIGALQAWEAFEPQDAAEALLIAQMIMVNDAAAAAMRRAAETLNTDERDRAISRSTQLMGMYQRQLAALDRHRGKGQQRITVERVAVVEAGGQAIVGNVEMPALAAMPQPGPGSDVDPRVATPTRARSRKRRAKDCVGTRCR